MFGTLSQTRNALDNRHLLQAFMLVVLGFTLSGSGARARRWP
jgi:hypothetical protein